MASVRNLELVAWRALGSAIPTAPARDSVSLRIVAHVPSFPPVVRAGSEVAMATTLRLLVARGHEATVIVDRDGITGEFDGLDVIARPSRRRLVGAYRRADVAFTQLTSRNRALRLGALTHRPVVHFLHMGGPPTGFALGRPDLLVFNAEWLRSRSAPGGDGIVFHPPLVPEAYATEPGTAVTLVNLNARKGGALFVELARRCPDREFLGVVGGWGAQDVGGTLPPNLEVLGPVEDMRDVYARTRVLLVMSDHESYGRVGLEAGCSGIPTIAAPLEGVREALGDAAVFAPRDDLDEWVAALHLLDDPGEYARRAGSARIRAHEVAALVRPEIVRLESSLLDLVGVPPA
jgi:hypothetical protein